MRAAEPMYKDVQAPSGEANTALSRETGSRERPKQYLPLAGRPVILHTLERLCSHPRVRGVLAGISPQDRHWPALIDEGPRPPKLLGSYQGGKTRAETVLNGLRALAAHAGAGDWVLVHDAVRPCVRHDDLDKLIEAVSDYPDGGLLALPISDTLKRADDEGRVLETVTRTGMWRAMTPQMFKLDTLKLALEQALKDKLEITDEAMAIERMGGRPRVVAGHPDNIKITLPADLALAELYLKQQQEELA